MISYLTTRVGVMVSLKISIQIKRFSPSDELCPSGMFDFSYFFSLAVPVPVLM